jgi:copper chaperone CopZ
MMAEKKIQFVYNTPITGVSKPTGAFDEESHRNLVLPIRGQLMQIDGVSNCFIARFGFYVEYYDEMTDQLTVAAAALLIIAAYGEKPADSGYFPLRGDKTPAALPEFPKTTKCRYQKVTTGTDSLVGYVTVDGNPNEFDADAFNAKVKPLVELLGNYNGVTKVDVTITSVDVTFDSRITTISAVRAHIEATLNATRQKEGFFPYVAEGDDLMLYFQYWDIPNVAEQY